MVGCCWLAAGFCCHRPGSRRLKQVSVRCGCPWVIPGHAIRFGCPRPGGGVVGGGVMRVVPVVVASWIAGEGVGAVFHGGNWSGNAVLRHRQTAWTIQCRCEGLNLPKGTREGQLGPQRKVLPTNQLCGPSHESKSLWDPSPES